MAARRYLLSELGDTEIARWADLAAGAVEPNPFFEPEYVLPAAEGLAEPDVSLLVVEADGEWRACLPVQRTRLGRVLGALRTWRHRYCFLGTPLLHPANPADAAHELLALGADEAPGSRLALEQFADDGPAGAAIRRAAQALSLATLVETRHERALLERSEDGQDASLALAQPPPQPRAPAPPDGGGAGGRPGGPRRGGRSVRRGALPGHGARGVEGPQRHGAGL